MIVEGDLLKAQRSCLDEVEPHVSDLDEVLSMKSNLALAISTKLSTSSRKDATLFLKVIVEGRGRSFLNVIVEGHLPILRYPSQKSHFFSANTRKNALLTWRVL